MELSDLFERPAWKSLTPGQRRELRIAAKQAQMEAAVPVLVKESLIVMMAAGKLRNAEPLSEDDDRRLLEAIERIESAKTVFYAR